MSRVGGYAPREPGSLKEAQQQLVTAVGGLDHAVELSRVGRSHIARYTSANEDDQFTNMPVDVMLRLEEAVKAGSGVPIVLHYLALQLGYALVPLDDAMVAENLHRHLSEIGSDFGSLISEAGKALEDEVVTPAEAGRMKREAMKISGTLARFTARLNAVIRGRGRDRHK